MRLNSRHEIEAWVAARRKVLRALIEREGLGQQIALTAPA
jgi:hypothetical protein